jgi:type I restriction enzyme S subunit
LDQLTAGPYGGIYRPPIFGMNFAQNTLTDERYGVRFLTGSNMMQVDLSGIPLVSRRMADSDKYRILKVKTGMTLISCSGAIGRAVYVRPDMDGMWSSQDVMKICPNTAKVRSGYLHAFLSSRFGRILVRAGTYGAIIPHVEREHLLTMPIPRFGDDIEQMAHELVERAARSRGEAAVMLDKARMRLREFVSDGASASGVWTSVKASEVQARLDAYYFSARCVAARDAFDRATTDTHLRLADVATVFIPGIFKRRYGDYEYGYPYITGSDVFQIVPESGRYLLRSIADRYRLVVSRHDILIQEAGQLGGLIGRGVLVGKHLNGFAVSNNMIRVTAHDKRDAGYLFALLSTPEGVLLVAREGAGSSIPHIDANRVRNLRIPWPSARIRREIGKDVAEAVELRDRACADERDARALVERAIEEAS